MLKHAFLEALARDCGHDTTYRYDEFVEFEDTFERWHNHILVTEYNWYRKPNDPFCCVEQLCVYSDLNLFARFARNWIIENVNVSDENNPVDFWKKVKEKVSVDFLGGNELSIHIFNDDIITKNLKVTFIDYNQVNPAQVGDADKWEIKNIYS